MVIDVQRSLAYEIQRNVMDSSGSITSISYKMNFVAGENASSAKVASTSYELRPGYLFTGSISSLPGTLQFSSATSSVAENGGTATLTVTRSGGSDGAASVDYATSDGTATAGADYTAANNTLNWADGDDGSKSFAITITDDSVVETNETVTITLSNFSGAGEGSQSTLTLNITDNDSTTPPPTPVTYYSVTFDLDGKGERTGGGALAQTVPKGSSATAPAVQADTGYVFAGWDKAFTNVQSNMTVTAQYTLKNYTLTYTAGPGGAVTGATEQTVEPGGAGTAVTAVPDDKYIFVSWSDGSTDNPRTDTNVMSDISVSAGFELKSVDAPFATLSDIPNSTTNTGSYRIIIGGIGVETYRYSLDNGAWSREISVGQPLTFALSEDGKHTLSVTGRNSEGIWQPQADATVFEWILDTTPPRAGMFNAPSGTVGATSIEVTVGGEDVKTYRYRLDSGEWSGILSVSAPVTAADLGEGVHTLEVIGADA
ncbi:MAG: hypothetical protein GY737_09040, partial [Desulfobacteraceae bacterium]|nr:hypothetical protein [Desulfobacteraceae bacterium]